MMRNLQGAHYGIRNAVVDLHALIQVHDEYLDDQLISHNIQYIQRQVGDEELRRHVVKQLQIVEPSLLEVLIHRLE